MSYSYQIFSRRGGRGRGRGRGAASTGHKWVRPTQDEETARDSCIADNVERESAVATAQSTTAVSQKGHMRSLPPSKSWKRPRENVEMAVTTEHSPQTSNETFESRIGGAKQGGNSSVVHGDTKPSLLNTAANVSCMTRRGTNKLVLNAKPSQTTLEAATPVANAAFASPRTIDSREEVAKPEPKAFQKGKVTNILPPMIKRGRHKLVLERSAAETTVGGQSSAALSRESETGNDQATGTPYTVEGIDDGKVHAHRGRHKLVLTNADSKGDVGIKGKWEQQHHLRHGNAKRQQVVSNRGRGGRGSMGRGAKRVRLNPEDDAPYKNDGRDESTIQAGEKYTEFAYRPKSSTSSSRHHRRGCASKGLVRVEPNAKTTPICTTYLRGLPCNNPKCTKRHDVPVEASTPICSFFQRHGQCNKGDACPFRHIKVNPHATVCPSFSLLGFCEDKECVMKHVRGTGAKRSIRPNNK